MTIYAIGDVQGCFDALEELLAQIHFDSLRDTLWFTGDLVNRGMQSLEVLRYVKALDEKHKMVLGNHDLHLLAVAYGISPPNRNDNLEAVLTAPDCDELIDWLRRRPLIHYNEQIGYVLTHAGLAPMWTLEKAIKLAKEVEVVLQGDAPERFLQHMYGNQPDLWRDDLKGVDRLRCIINYFTRMRVCDAEGRMDLSYKGTRAEISRNLMPWFEVPKRANANNKIIFGHWAALGGKTDVPNVYALDTGCVWGNCLTAMRLGDERRFSVNCKK